VLWDLSNPRVEDVCVAWRKGLTTETRIEHIPHYTHSYLLAPLCATLPLRDELSWRFINFSHSCLSSDSDSVRFVARHGVYFRRMLSPKAIGRNAQYCCLRYSASLASFTSINKSRVWHCTQAAVSGDV